MTIPHTTRRGPVRPLFSVIIPVRNDTRNLCATLAALSEQSLDEPFEVIVSDNGSDDDVAATVADSHAKLDLQVIDATAAHGSYGARNMALAQARGKYLAFTDADTVPARDWLAALYRAFQRNGNNTMLGGQIHHIWKTDQPSLPELVDAQRHLKQEFYVNHIGFAATANMAIARDHAMRLGGFDDRFRSGGDLLFGVCARAANLRLLFVSDAIVHHRARHTVRALLAKTGRVSRAARGRHAVQGSTVKTRAELKKFLPRGVRTRMFRLSPPFRSTPMAFYGFCVHWLLDAYCAAVMLGWLDGGDDAFTSENN